MTSIEIIQSSIFHLQQLIDDVFFLNAWENVSEI